MRSILTLTFTIFTIQLASAQITHLTDSSWYETWNTPTSTWVPSERQVSYNRLDCIDYDSTLRYVWNAVTNDWRMNYGYYTSYDVNKVLNSFVGVNKTSGNPFYKYIYFYSGGKMSEYILQYWQNHLSALRNDTRLVYHRNSTTGLIDTTFVLRWDTVSNIWRSSQKTAYLRNANSIITGYQYLNYNGTGYVNSGKIDYTLNPANKISSSMSYKWDTITSTWLITSRSTNTYDANNFCTSSLNESWNTSTSTWTNSTRQTYTPTAFNETYTSTSESWQSASSSWRNNSRYTYWYGCVYSTGIDDLKDESALVTVYPNPASNTITIDNTQQYFDYMQIVDISGKCISSFPLHDGQNSIYISDLVPSTYFIHFTGSNGHTVKRFIKE